MSELSSMIVSVVVYAFLFALFVGRLQQRVVLRMLPLRRNLFSWLDEHMPRAICLPRSADEQQADAAFRRIWRAVWLRGVLQRLPSVLIMMVLVVVIMMLAHASITVIILVAALTLGMLVLPISFDTPAMIDGMLHVAAKAIEAQGCTSQELHAMLPMHHTISRMTTADVVCLAIAAHKMTVDRETRW